MSERLFLSFDDGPDEEWTPRVLGELARLGAHATFFLIGERLRAFPWIARAAEAAGHGVELHCERHIRHTELTEHQIEADTIAALASFAEVGLFPTRWRTPWGICTPETVRVAERHGLELVHWSIDTHDWRGDSVRDMLAVAARGLEDGAVVLMHDGLGPGSLRLGCENTLGLLAPLCSLAAKRKLSVADALAEPTPASVFLGGLQAAAAS
ncbi:MAG: polysaccharide deacetylase family protein [Solirubrobacteraceae bacterium]